MNLIEHHGKPIMIPSRPGKSVTDHVHFLAEEHGEMVWELRRAEVDETKTYVGEYLKPGLE